MVRRSAGFSSGRSFCTPRAVESSCLASFQEVSYRPIVTLSIHVEVIRFSDVCSCHIGPKKIYNTPLPREVVQDSIGVLEGMQCHGSADSRVVLVSAKGAEAVGFCKKGL